MRGQRIKQRTGQALGRSGSPSLGSWLILSALLLSGSFLALRLNPGGSGAIAQELPPEVPAEAPPALPPEAVPEAPPLAPADPSLEDFLSEEEVDVLPPVFVLPEALPDGSQVQIQGSAALTVINRALDRQFTATFPTATVAFTETDSATALAALTQGTVDLAAIGRPLTPEERAQGLVEVAISREKIAVFVRTDNPFQGELTFDQFARILRGQITRWEEVGGPEGAIIFVDRPGNSDTRLALGGYDIFKAEGLIAGPTAVTVAEDSTAAVVAALGNRGVGYGIASQVLDQPQLRVVAMHGTLPDDPRYPYSQPRSYVYREGQLTPAAAAFLAVATGAEGQGAIAQAKDIEAAIVAAAELAQRSLALGPGEGSVTGDQDGQLQFWQRNGSPVGEPILAHQGPVTALEWSGGDRLISGGADGVVRFWDGSGNPLGEPISAHGQPVSAIAPLGDGSFYTSSTDGTVRRWDSQGAPLGDPFVAHRSGVLALGLSPDGETLYTAGSDGMVRRWDSQATLQGELAGHSGPVTALGVTPRGELLSTGEDGTVRRWDGEGSALGDPWTAAAPVRALALSPDGQRVMVADRQGNLQGWALGDGAPLPLVNVGEPVQALAFSADGERLITVLQQGPPQRRNPDGTPRSGGGFTFPNVGWGNWQEMVQNLSPRLWVLLPVIVLGLLLGKLLQGAQQEVAEAEEDAPVAALPPAAVTVLPPVTAEAEAAGAEESPAEPVVTVGAKVSPAAPEGSPVGLVPSAVGAVSPYEASQSLDSELSRARIALTRGIEQTQAGNFQGALEWVNQAIEAADVERLKSVAAGVSLVGVGAIMARALTQRSTILAALGRMEEARQSQDQAIALDPTNATHWIAKGQLMLKESNPAGALTCFDQAIEHHGQSAPAWHGKSTALAQLNRPDEARAALTQAQTLAALEDSLTPAYAPPPPLAPPPPPPPRPAADALAAVFTETATPALGDDPLDLALFSQEDGTPPLDPLAPPPAESWAWLEDSDSPRTPAPPPPPPRRPPPPPPHNPRVPHSDPS